MHLRFPTGSSAPEAVPLGSGGHGRQAAQPRRLVVLSAPAGYGKSTLLRQWSCEDPRSFAWLDVPADADDPLALLGYLVQALHLRNADVLSGPLTDDSFLTAVAL